MATLGAIVGLILIAAIVWEVFNDLLEGRFLHTRSHNREVIFEALAADHLVNR